jgi:hypothetical protein
VSKPNLRRTSASRPHRAEPPSCGVTGPAPCSQEPFFPVITVPAATGSSQPADLPVPPEPGQKQHGVPGRVGGGCGEPRPGGSDRLPAGRRSAAAGTALLIRRSVAAGDTAACRCARAFFHGRPRGPGDCLPHRGGRLLKFANLPENAVEDAAFSVRQFASRWHSRFSITGTLPAGSHRFEHHADGIFRQRRVFGPPWR